MTPEEIEDLAESVENEIKELIKSGEWSLQRYEEMVEKFQPVLDVDPTAIEVVAKFYNLEW